jgi:hypothetical protein
MNTGWRRRVGPLLLAAALAVTAPTAHADTGPDFGGYIHALQNDGILPANTPTDAAVTVGAHVCGMLHSGMDALQVTRLIETKSGGFTPSQVEAIVIDAHSFLCPGEPFTGAPIGRLAP